jgi:hypothetical protein
MTQADGSTPKKAVTRSVLTDVHFWVPFIVLVLGVTVLVICARA